MPGHTSVEHLGDPYVGAWYIPDAITAEQAALIVQEVRSSGLIEPIWDQTELVVPQVFERMYLDLRREHQFPAVAETGRALGATVVKQVAPFFPAAADFVPEEAAVQIYPACTHQALGWHRDNINDDFLIISLAVTGTGELAFTEKINTQDVRPEDIVARIVMQPLSALVFRANGLFVREDGSDIRMPHAVTWVDPGEDRFTIQYRTGQNSTDYGNTIVNADRPILQAS